MLVIPNQFHIFFLSSILLFLSSTFHVFKPLLIVFSHLKQNPYADNQTTQYIQLSSGLCKIGKSLRLHLYIFNIKLTVCNIYTMTNINAGFSLCKFLI